MAIGLPIGLGIVELVERALRHVRLEHDANGVGFGEDLLASGHRAPLSACIARIARRLRSIIGQELPVWISISSRMVGFRTPSLSRPMRSSNTSSSAHRMQ